MKPRAEAADGAVHDVVVVGAGGAGMTAALAAARQGLDTVVIEKSEWFGGSTAYSPAASPGPLPRTQRATLLVLVRTMALLVNPLVP